MLTAVSMSPKLLELEVTIRRTILTEDLMAPGARIEVFCTPLTGDLTRVYNGAGISGQSHGR